jgi:hypothetical protein
MDDAATQKLLGEIAKQLAMIATHLETLAKVARYQNPDAFRT